MRIPLINGSSEVVAAVQRVLASLEQGGAQGVPTGKGSGRRRSSRAAARMVETAVETAEKPAFELVPVTAREAAIEYINYQMPALLVVDFAEGDNDSFPVMAAITADPWLNHGSIIALYSGADTYERLRELPDSHIVIYLHHQDIERELGAVLSIVRSNEQILFQRALQTDLLSTVSGEFELTADVMLVPAYANLVANYLFNVGFLDGTGRAGASLVLTELLTNAILHGTCGISSREKQAHLNAGGSMQALIDRKCRSAKVRRRRVHYGYEMRRDHSRHVIRDEGPGFDWRAHLAKLDAAEMDFLAEHGRGILLARQHVSRLEFNEAGNEVTLEFRHRAGTNIPGVLRDNEIVEVRAGDQIIRQGDSSDCLYFVASGEFRVLVNDNHVANLSPADVLMGEMSFLLEETRSATVIANTDGRLVKISKEDFVTIVKHQPYYALFLSKLMAKRLHRLSRGRLS